jgi:hypothetical protein
LDQIIVRLASIGEAPSELVRKTQMRRDQLVSL